MATSKTDMKNGTLSHFPFQPETEIIFNKMGIPEPVSENELNPLEFDVVLVPLLAADINGNRVGYGGGYYDRFLSQTREDCLRVGVSFFEPIAEITDIEAYDCKLHQLITPERIYSFS